MPKSHLWCLRRLALFKSHPRLPKQITRSQWNRGVKIGACPTNIRAPELPHLLARLRLLALDLYLLPLVHLVDVVIHLALTLLGGEDPTPVQHLVAVGVPHGPILVEDEAAIVDVGVIFGDIDDDLLHTPPILEVLILGPPVVVVEEDDAIHAAVIRIVGGPHIVPTRRVAIVGEGGAIHLSGLVRLTREMVREHHRFAAEQ